MLKMFFRDIDEPLYGLEISKALKASPGTIHRELNAMLKQGVIKKKKKKALVMYYLNTGHPYFYELKRAVLPKKKINRVLLMSDLHLSAETPADMIEDFHLFLDYAEEHASEIVFVGDMLEMLQGDVFQTYLLHKPIFDRITRLSHDLKITYIPGNHDSFTRLMSPEGEGASSLFDSKINFSQEYYNAGLGIYASHGHQYDDFSEMKASPKVNRSPSNGKIIANTLKDLKREGYSIHQSKLLAVADYADKARKFSDYISSRKIDYSAKFEKIAKELIRDQDYTYVVFGHTHHAKLKKINHSLYLNTGSWKSEKKRQFVEIDKEGGALVAMDELK